MSALFILPIYIYTRIWNIKSYGMVTYNLYLYSNILFFITMFNTKCFNKPYIVCAILDSNVLLMMYDTKAANGAGAAQPWKHPTSSLVCLCGSCKLQFSFKFFVYHCFSFCPFDLLLLIISLASSNFSFFLHKSSMYGRHLVVDCINLNCQDIVLVISIFLLALKVLFQLTHSYCKISTPIHGKVY